MFGRGGVEISAIRNSALANPRDVDAWQGNPVSRRHRLRALSHPILNLPDGVQLLEGLICLAAGGSCRVHVRFDQPRNHRLAARIDGARLGTDPFLNIFIRSDGYEDAVLDCDCGNARDRKSTRLNSSHGYISYAVFCLKK